MNLSSLSVAVKNEIISRFCYWVVISRKFCKNSNLNSKFFLRIYTYFFREIGTMKNLREVFFLSYFGYFGRFHNQNVTTTKLIHEIQYKNFWMELFRVKVLRKYLKELMDRVHESWIRSKLQYYPLA